MCRILDLEKLRSGGTFKGWRLVLQHAGDICLYFAGSAAVQSVHAVQTAGIVFEFEFCAVPNICHYLAAGLFYLFHVPHICRSLFFYFIENVSVL